MTPSSSYIRYWPCKASTMPSWEYSSVVSGEPDARCSLVVSLQAVPLLHLRDLGAKCVRASMAPYVYIYSVWYYRVKHYILIPGILPYEAPCSTALLFSMPFWFKLPFSGNLGNFRALFGIQVGTRLIFSGKLVSLSTTAGWTTICCHLLTALSG